MALLDIITKGSADRSVTLKIVDSTDGTPETGALYNSTGIDMWYRREGGALVSITEAELSTPAVDDSHLDGGFIHISDGDYRLDLPDAAFATGANYVDVGGHVDGMVVIGGRVKLIDVNLEDTVRMGMTALPNAAVEGSGGLFTRGSGAGQINQSANGQIDANVTHAAGTAWNSGAISASTLGAACITAAKIATGAFTSTKFAAGAFDAVWSVAARTLTAATNITTAIASANRSEMDSGSTQLAAIVEDTNELQAAGIPAAITALQAKLLGYFQLLARSDSAIATDKSTELGEINADEGSGAGSYDNATDSVQSLRDRGDTAWTTGGGGSITDILNVKPVIPTSIDLADTATVRLGFMLTNAVDDLPSTAEITPGTISIDRKAAGGTSWSSVVSDSACSEQAGFIYFDEVFDAGTGYAQGDSIRVTFKSQKITVSANDYEVTDSNGVMFQTYIRLSVLGSGNISAAAANKLADHYWRRHAANVRASSDGDSVIFRSGLGAMSKLVNKVGVVGTDLLIREEDDSTTFGTQALTTDANADPITDIDTA